MDQYSDCSPGDYVHGFPQVLDYRTPQDGGNSRTAEFTQAQYQSVLGNPLEQQPDLSQHLFDQHVAWRDRYGNAHPNFHPLDLAENSFDADELQVLSRPADEEPWTSTAVSSAYLPNDPHSFHALQYPTKAHTFAGGLVSSGYPRSSWTPARETFVTPPDSGFESVPPAILGNKSSLDQFRVPPTPDTSVVGSDLPVPTPRSVRSDSRLQTKGDCTKRRRTKAPETRCPHCDKLLKNPSEEKKHVLQHTKPIRCCEADCTKGFATKNDLQRHRKSVHGLCPTVGQRTGYVCLACPSPSPGSARKWWPRRDNFKAHVRRRHGIRNETDLIGRSERPRPENARSESGYGSFTTHSVAGQVQTYQHELTGFTAMPASRRVSQPDSNHWTFFDVGHLPLDSLACVGEGPSAPSFPDNRDPDSGHYGPGCGATASDLSMLHDAALRIDSPADANWTLPAALSQNTHTIGSRLLQSRQNLLDTAYTQRNEFPSSSIVRGSIPRDQRSSNVQDDLGSHRRDSGDYQCPACPKTKKRECDLRKHLKRHTRPYGCTFPDCSKEFGSRNDWKRHETSQHALNNVWRCTMCPEDYAECGKLFFQEENFVNHLHRKHELPSASRDIARHGKAMHLGREGSGHFWCGFCETLIMEEGSLQQDDSQRNAWNARLAHIGDHFDKDNRGIDQWLCMEHKKPKGLLTKESQTKRTRSRKKTHSGRDDGDLGDDGIPSTFCAGNTSSMSSQREQILALTGSHRRKFDDADLDAEGDSDSGW